MKKLLSSLLVCFVLITCCNATSTVGDVYFNEFEILVNDSKYTPSLPILNYQNRTYLPLNEFGTLTGNNISFNNGTISIDSQEQLVNYQQLFFVYSILAGLDKSLTNSNLLFHDCYSYYYLTYINRDLGKQFQNSLNSLQISIDSSNTYYDFRDTVVEFCINNNLATSKEVNEMFDNIKYYPACLKMFADRMSAQIISNESFSDYSSELNLCDNGLSDILVPLQKIESAINNRILVD